MPLLKLMWDAHCSNQNLKGKDLCMGHVCYQMITLVTGIKLMLFYKVCFLDAMKSGRNELAVCTFSHCSCISPDVLLCMSGWGWMYVFGACVCVCVYVECVHVCVCVVHACVSLHVCFKRERQSERLFQYWCIILQTSEELEMHCNIFYSIKMFHSLYSYNRHHLQNSVQGSIQTTYSIIHKTVKEKG